MLRGARAALADGGARNCGMPARPQTRLLCAKKKVLVSWMPAGIDFSASIRGCAAVAEYIVLGEADGATCGKTDTHPRAAHPKKNVGAATDGRRGAYGPRSVVADVNGRDARGEPPVVGAIDRPDSSMPTDYNQYVTITHMSQLTCQNQRSARSRYA